MKGSRKTSKFDPEKDERRFPFTRDQISRIESFYPEFEAEVEEHDPSYAGKNAKVTEWKKQKAKDLLKEPLFESLSTEKVTLDQWEDAIRCLYTNRFNYKMKKAKKATGSNATKESSTRNSLFIFTGEITARQYFIHENHAKIQELYTKICRDTGKPGGAARQQACKILWDQADHQEWEEKVASMLKDTAANQAEFEDVITESFEKLLTSGILGSCAISLSYGFRNEKDEVVAGKINIAYDKNTSELQPTDFESDMESVARWADHASKPLILSTELRRTDDGTPLFPAINLMETPPARIATIVRDYFTAMWHHARGSVDIPWDDIARSPDSYYSTEGDMPASVKRPTQYHVGELINLAMYLAHQGFNFYPEELHSVGDAPANLLAADNQDIDAPSRATMVNPEKDTAPSTKDLDDELDEEEEEHDIPRRPTTTRKSGRVLLESPSPPPSVLEPSVNENTAQDAAAVADGGDEQTMTEPSAPSSPKPMDVSVTTALSTEEPSAPSSPKKKTVHRGKGQKRQHEEASVPSTESNEGPRGRPRRTTKAPDMRPQLLSDPSKPPPKKTRLADRYQWDVVPVESTQKKARKS
ncbi:hypothetical protein CPC08DRAFT_767223 [Agrocybe pediades]|nr:hypothetical protein CPC08DRAFT_767223 [Agrocybe pediades]